MYYLYLLAILTYLYARYLHTRYLHTRYLHTRYLHTDTIEIYSTSYDEEYATTHHILLQ